MNNNNKINISQGNGVPPVEEVPPRHLQPPDDYRVDAELAKQVMKTKAMKPYLKEYNRREALLASLKRSLEEAREKSAAAALSSVKASSKPVEHAIRSIESPAGFVASVGRRVMTLLPSNPAEVAPAQATGNVDSQFGAGDETPGQIQQGHYR